MVICLYNITMVIGKMCVFISQMLLDWINDELAHLRIIVKDLEEDLFDGQILQKLVG